MTEEEKKIIDTFKNFIKSKEREQEQLYEDELFYKDDIEQNELFLKMLNSIDSLIQKQQSELKKKDKIIDEMATYFGSGLSMCEDCEKCFEAKDIYEYCKQCIKQYFEREVNNE